MRRKIAILVVAVMVLIGSRADAVLAPRVTVATTATLIFTAPLAGVSRVLIRNPGAVSVYVGPATVTTANGFEIAGGDAMAINLGYGDTIYGIVAASTQVVYTIIGANPQ